MKDSTAEAPWGEFEFLHSSWDFKAQATTCEGLLEMSTHIMTPRGLLQWTRRCYSAHLSPGLLVNTAGRVTPPESACSAAPLPRAFIYLIMMPSLNKGCRNKIQIMNPDAQNHKCGLNGCWDYYLQVMWEFTKTLKLCTCSLSAKIHSISRKQQTQQWRRSNSQADVFRVYREVNVSFREADAP